LERVEERFNAEMDIVTLINKLRQFDSMLKHLKGKNDKALLKLNENAVIEEVDKSTSSSNSDSCKSSSSSSSETAPSNPTVNFTSK